MFLKKAIKTRTGLFEVLTRREKNLTEINFETFKSCQVFANGFEGHCSGMHTVILIHFDGIHEMIKSIGIHVRQHLLWSEPTVQHCVGKGWTGDDKNRGTKGNGLLTSSLHFVASIERCHSRRMVHLL